MLQKYLFWNNINYHYCYYRRGKTSHYFPRFLFQSHISIHSFIWGMVFESSCASHEAEGCRGEQVRHSVCRLVFISYLSSFLSPLPRCFLTVYACCNPHSSSHSWCPWLLGRGSSCSYLCSMLFLDKLGGMVDFSSSAVSSWRAGSSSGPGGS